MIGDSTSAPTRCLDDAQIAALGAGQLDDAALRDVDTHLDTCPACLDLVAAAMAKPDRAPARVGRYRILERLGSGALGVVYAAVDETLDRRVALKLLRPDRGDPDGVEHERMLREARALARLEHPNAVGVYDAGEVDGVAFVAMRLVRGQTLRAHCRQLPWSAVLECYLHAARGLIAAHEVGLVHRDFKPDNVLVDDTGGVFVCDFGLAGWSREAGGAAATRPTGDQDLTATGHTPGTPLYMAPELWNGEPASPASDQFAFCVSVWESLTGRPPFNAASTEELRAQLRQPPAVGQLHAAGIPTTLISALVRGLAVDPHDRHPTMPALLATLVRVRWRRRARVALGVAASVLVSAWLAFGTAGSDHSCADAAGARASAPTLTRTDLDAAAAARLQSALYEYADDVAAVDQGQCEARLAGTSADADRCLDGRLEAYQQLVAALDELPAAVVGSQGLAAVHALSAPTGCLLRGPRQSTWLADSELRARLGATVLVADRVEPLVQIGAVDRARQQLDTALEQLAAEPPSSYLVQARLARLGVDEMLGQPVAGEAYDALVQIATAHDDLSLAARLWSRRLGSAANGGAMQQLPALLDTAKWAFELADRPAEVAASFHEASGFAAMQLRRYDDASAHLRAAIDTVASREGAAHPKVAELRGAWAMVEYRRGQLPAALAAATDAWTDLEPTVDPGFSALPMMALNIATFHGELQQPQRAVQWAHRGLSAMERGARIDPLLRGALVEIVVLNDDVDAAVAAAQEQIAAVRDADPYIRGRAARTAGRAASRASDPVAARTHLQAAQAEFAAAHATGDLVATQWDLAKLAQRSGDFQTATELMEDVVAQESQLPGFDAATQAMLRIELAELAMDRARPHQAARALTQARKALETIDSPALQARADATAERLTTLPSQVEGTRD